LFSSSPFPVSVSTSSCCLLLAFFGTFASNFWWYFVRFDNQGMNVTTGHAFL
jgi:hypothetical protein